MMPVDALCSDGTGRPRIRTLKALKLACVHGIAVEVWWGIVERFSPLAYDWSLYGELFKLIGDQNKHIYYWNQNEFSNDDYLTLGVDHVPLFCGRTALHCYEDFRSSFAKKFEFLIGTNKDCICIYFKEVIQGIIPYKILFGIKSQCCRNPSFSAVLGWLFFCKSSAENSVAVCVYSCWRVQQCGWCCVWLTDLCTVSCVCGIAACVAVW
ncbi:hypothetical protein DVH24_003949 [Malus domestica]|uniref:Beta-amylase n=1 Tax=Malus domestica TaxID=3750 RepID=A0A498K7H5_MALDO|nr:hypothetical protein DVH24_003949 [Malus domestica]